MFFLQVKPGLGTLKSEKLKMQKLALVDIKTEFGGPVKDLTDVGTLVSTIVTFAYVAAGVVFLILLIMGGLSMIQAAGTDDRQKATKGRQGLTTALIGFLIIISSYFIIQVIGNIFGFKILQ